MKISEGSTEWGAKSGVTFVILTWNSENDIEECVDSLVECCERDSVDYRIRVVDNGSVDRTTELLKKIEEKNRNVHSILLDKNFGTTRSRNIALKQVETEFVCVIDSDTQIIEGSISTLLDYLRSNRDTGLLAPKLLLPDGTVQNSVKRFPTLPEKILKGTSVIKGIKYSVRDFYKDFPFRNVKPVDTAISACWIFPSHLLKDIGYLDEKIFYAPEDVDFSLRVWKSGKKVVYYPQFTILHKTQQISYAKPISKISISHFLGLIYYFRKHKYCLSRKRIYKKLSGKIPGYSP